MLIMKQTGHRAFLEADGKVAAIIALSSMGGETLDVNGLWSIG